MKRAIAFATACLFGAAFGDGLAAAPAKPAARQNCKIIVDSDKFIADLNAKTGTYSGNVVVTQCDTRLHADSVRINTVNNQADKVLASGNVVVDSPASGTATGEQGVYDVPKKMVTLSGNVVLKKGKDVMRGARLTVNLVTGQATLGAGAKGAASTQPTRVQGVFNPTQDQSQAPPGPSR